ncbi:MAG: AbrB/MazE/SpoVT family DNA-binding domain-containing protein [Ethanoligenens sp.]
MKLLETTATVDRKGRLHIPAATLAELSLIPGDEIRVLLSDDPDALQAAWRAFVSGCPAGDEDNAEDDESDEEDEEAEGFLLSADMLRAASFHPGERLLAVCGARAIEITPSQTAPANPIDPLLKHTRELRVMTEDGESPEELLLPIDLMEDAGFVLDELLQVACGSRKIVITAKKKIPLRADPMDRLPKGLRELCDDLGFDPDTVRAVLEEGAYFQ